MVKNVFLLMIISLMFLNCSSGEQSLHEISYNESNGKNIQILIPNSWIERLYDIYSLNNKTELVKDLSDIIFPLKFDELDYDLESDNWSINPIFADIDSDLENEILAIFRNNYNDPVLLVFKKIDKKWYLLYLESFYVHYNEPELYIANNYSPNKTFYIRCIHSRGSGIYKDAYHFYKLIDNKVYPCLVLINEARIIGWWLPLNQDVRSSFKFHSTSNDGLWVVYEYNFFPGPVYESDASWEGHPDIYFVKDLAGLPYIWDNETKTYLPDYYGNDQKLLTEEKLMCFDNFSNDQLFIRAFDYEINETLKNGTDEQKDLLQLYLNNINEK